MFDEWQEGRAIAEIRIRLTHRLGSPQHLNCARGLDDTLSFEPDLERTKYEENSF